MIAHIHTALGNIRPTPQQFTDISPPSTILHLIPQRSPDIERCRIPRALRARVRQVSAQIQPFRHAQRRVRSDPQCLGTRLEQRHGIQGDRSSLLLVLGGHARHLHERTRRIRLPTLGQKSIDLILIKTPSEIPRGTYHGTAIHDPQIQRPIRLRPKRFHLQMTRDAESQRGRLARPVAQHRRVQIAVPSLKVPRLESRERHAHLEIQFLTRVDRVALIPIGFPQGGVGLLYIGRVDRREVRSVHAVVLVVSS
mmetsp:Transcript_2478/g.5367  ORF Transcript_2478/g.5367 Transcript_2478/m.5367 type:complete len:253 (-) Transcript_2478:686-1444(-)